MAKKTSTSSSIPNELNIARIEAKEMLKVQVDSGNNLDIKNISTKEEFVSVEKEYNKWNDYNLELLEQMFTGRKFKREFSSSGLPSVYMMREKYFSKKVSDLKTKVLNKIEVLESIINRLDLIKEVHSVKQSSESDSRIVNKIKNNNVFIVHGHDNEAKEEAARFMEKMGFKPIILHEQASGGKTIIEKIEEHSGVDFGIILYTPCDLGKAKNDKELNNRARQNVVFEHGYLIGKLGWSNVCALVKGNVEKPGDIGGVVYVSMDKGDWKTDVAKEMKKSGLNVDFNKLYE